MKVTVLGATGLIGGALSNHLSELGYEVDGTGSGGRSASRDRRTTRKLDVLSEDIVLPEGTQAVFYLCQASPPGRFPIDSGKLFGVNCWGALKAAESAFRSGVKFFCFASSGSVYRPSFAPLTEDSPLREDEPYALSKVLAEKALRLFPGPMRISAVRLFGVFGRGQTTRLAAQLASRIQTGTPISICPSPFDPQDSAGLRISMTYAKDVSRSLVFLMERALEGGEVPEALNVASSRVVSIREVAEMLGEILGVPPVFETLADPRKADLHADVGLLMSLGGPVSTNLDEALRESFLPRTM